MLGQVVRWKITEPRRVDSGIFQAWESTAGAECCPPLRTGSALSCQCFLPCSREEGEGLQRVREQLGRRPSSLPAT